MPRDWRIRLSDIREAAERALSYVKDIEFDDFKLDQLRQDAVVRCLEVIGEAARHTPPEVRTQFPDVPWDDLVGMRNLLAHEYFGVDLKILWVTATEDLPELLGALKRN